MELVGAIGNDQGEMPRAECSDQKVEQVARRAIRPMKILDHQHEGGTLGKAHQQQKDTTEELDLFEFVVGGPGRKAFVYQSGEESAEIGNGIDEVAGELALLGTSPEFAKGVHEGDVRKADVSSLHATAGEDTHTSFLGSAGEFGE
jgi:hypothetical protein